jgi:hypothetical protein
MSSTKTPTPVRNLTAALKFARRDLPPGTTMVPGRTLALYREANDVAAGEVAQRLDVSKQRISAMEKDGCSPKAAFQYRGAIDQIAAERAAKAAAEAKG